jgi:hypothetical protein
MRSPALLVTAVIAGCAAEPDAILVVAQPGALDPAKPATVDVMVGVDRGIELAPLTGTRAMVLNSFPDDTERAWDDTTMPYTIQLVPDEELASELYVVLHVAQGNRRFAADLAKPLRYPGAGFYRADAEVYPRGRGVCPFGRAEDEGYYVELVPEAQASTLVDCDRDGAPYPLDCVDFDADIRPSPAIPASSGVPTPPERMCCNGPTREPAHVTVSSSGPAACGVEIGCANADPILGRIDLDWIVVGTFGTPEGLPLCECAELEEPLDCLSGAHTRDFAGQYTSTPFCNVPVDDSGAVCAGQATASTRAWFSAYLPPDTEECAVRVLWQTGAVELSFRGQGETTTQLSTTDCDADLVFTPVGSPFANVAENGAIGWAILRVGERNVPFHVHPLRGGGDCAQRGPECSYE